ncbi:LysE family translocator [Arhodomonas sp. AD133]|uniref:LysE family translocator n=1 Tax=Arhodomonas sp. AD133 TaxID=3415009 RepID=UPI003EB91C6B
MLGTENLAGFLLVSLVLWLTPGPDTMYILSRSITQGCRAGLLSCLGIGAGILLHTALAAVGLSAVLAASAWAFTAVKVAGAGYLVYLGIRSIMTPAGATTAPGISAANGWRIFREGFVTNTLNPKIAVFFLAFLPQFVDAEAVVGPVPFVFLGVVFVTGGTLWCALVAVAAARLTGVLRARARVLRWMERIAGSVYVGLGLNLLRARG